MTKLKRYLEDDVCTAAEKRISFIFDKFEKIYVAFSGGKDSSVLFHMMMKEAIKRNRKIGVLFIDWECQFDFTINHVKNMFDLYSDNIIPFWIQLEIMTNNASSVIEPIWNSWDENKKLLWTRKKQEQGTYTHGQDLPFYYKGITFEEFVVLFGVWFSDGEPCAALLGLRAQESYNRFRTLIMKNKDRFENIDWSTNIESDVWNFFPLYDWKTDDIWIYNAKNKCEYNKIYDRMHQAGLSIHMMRIDEPFGEEARRSLWLYQVIEPETWRKFMVRISGINMGALYGNDNGNIFGNNTVTLPNGQTWKNFSMMLLNSMPQKTSEHYKNKIAVYLKWYKDKDKSYENDIPDYVENYKDEQKGTIPAWRQICRALLKNDYWCRSLGFGITKSSAYEKYLALMKRKRNEWEIFSEKEIQ